MKTEKRSWKQMHDDLWKETLDGLCSAYDILKRGYCICEVDGQKKLLIVGINPSFRKGDSPGNSTYQLLKGEKDKTDSYWKYVAGMLKDSSCDLINDAAYVDVFSCRGAHQSEIMDKIIRNPFLKPYVVKQVEYTQKIIETVIKPKVIIIKFKSAWAFFGKEECTWMGYTFEKIDQFNDFEVCKITGFSDSEDRINKSDFTDTNLKGSIVVFAKHNYLEQKDFYPTPEKIKHWVDMVK